MDFPIDQSLPLSKLPNQRKRKHYSHNSGQGLNTTQHLYVSMSGELSPLESSLSNELPPEEHPPEEAVTKKQVSDAELTLVFVGRTGAGKSTLRNNILNIKKREKLSASSVTKQSNCMTTSHKGVTLNIYDTAGLEIDVQKTQQNSEILREIYESTGGHADLIVYCISVSPGDRFSERLTMCTLQKAYGAGIWKHCIFAFTFSNRA